MRRSGSGVSELPRWRGGRAAVPEDPFAVLGLAARGDLTDEDVRAAWRRIAAATHPDRDDGGDPGIFGAAAAAYNTLRTSFGRGEALADLGLAGSAPRAVRHPARHARRARAGGWTVGGRGRRLALRAAAAAGATAAAVLVAGWTPATIGLLAGALTWVAVTSRADLLGRGGGLPRRAGRDMGYKVPPEGPEVSRIFGTRRVFSVIRGTGRWRWGGWDR